MIFWIALIFVVLLVSFLLSVRSMWSVGEYNLPSTSHQLVRLTAGQFQREEFWQSIHKWSKRAKEFVACEMRWRQGLVQAYMFAPEDVLRQLASQGIEYEEADDYSSQITNYQLSVCELRPQYDFLLPVKMTDFDFSISHVLEHDQELWWQVVLFASGDDWKKRGMIELGRATEGEVSRTRHLLTLVADVIHQALSIFLPGPVHHGQMPQPIAAPLSEIEKKEVEQIEEKIAGQGFVAVVRVAIACSTLEVAKSAMARLEDMVGQLTHGGINRLVTMPTVTSRQELLSRYQERRIALVGQRASSATDPATNEFILTTRELAGLWNWLESDVNLTKAIDPPMASPTSKLSGEIRLS